MGDIRKTIIDAMEPLVLEGAKAGDIVIHMDRSTLDDFKAELNTDRFIGLSGYDWQKLFGCDLVVDEAPVKGRPAVWAEWNEEESDD